MIPDVDALIEVIEENPLGVNEATLIRLADETMGSLCPACPVL